MYPEYTFYKTLESYMYVVLSEKCDYKSYEAQNLKGMTMNLMGSKIWEKK